MKLLSGDPPNLPATGKEIYDNIQGMFDNRTSSNTKPEGITLQGLDKKNKSTGTKWFRSSKLLSEITQQTSNLSELSRALINQNNICNNYSEHFFYHITIISY